MIKKVLIGLGVVVVVAAGIDSSNDKPAKEAPVPAAPQEEIQAPQEEVVEKVAEYKAEVAMTEVQNPATLLVYFTIKNVGNATGSPQCTVDASDQSGTYSGFDIFDIGPLEPKEATAGNGMITIENEGAGFVTKTSVKCS